jgi:hypothetical protein
MYFKYVYIYFRANFLKTSELGVPKWTAYCEYRSNPVIYSKIMGGGGVEFFFLL